MGCVLRIGRLRHRIIIQQVTETRDAAGSVIESWDTFATVWGGMDPIAGREYFAAKQTQAETTHRIRIRYLSGVLPKMRVFWDSRTFDITQVINYGERNEEMHLMATEAI